MDNGFGNYNAIHIKDELKKRFKNICIKVNYIDESFKVEVIFNLVTYKYNFNYDECIYNTYNNFIESIVCETSRFITRLILNNYFKETYLIQSYLDDKKWRD